MAFCLSGSGSVRVELLPVRSVGSAVFLPGGVTGASVRSVCLRVRNPRGETEVSVIHEISMSQTNGRNFSQILSVFIEIKNN